MAVSSEVARVVHTANGTATFFSYAPMDGVTSANLKVYLFNPTTGVLTPQTLGTHYTFGSGGVTFNTAPPSGRRVILFRQVELLQPDIYKTNAPFPAVVTEKRFDEIVKGLQQINDVVQNRSIILPLGDAGFSTNVLPAVENRKGRVLYFNATTGDPEAKQLADTVVTAPAWAITFLSQSTAAAGLSSIGAVARAGDTMTGFLTLHADPTAAMHAATKAYADRSGPGGSTGAIAMTSGTTYDVTGIPSWANVVEVFFFNVIVSSSTHILLNTRLGTSNGFVTSGYVSATGIRNAEHTSTTQFLTAYVRNDPMNVIVRMVRAHGDTWVQAHVGSIGGGFVVGGGGSVYIGDVLTQIRVFIETSAFTGGHFVVRWTA